MINNYYKQGEIRMFDEDAGLKEGLIYLPMCCHQFIIGDKDNVEFLIKDLQEIKEKITWHTNNQIGMK